MPLSRLRDDPAASSGDVRSLRPRGGVAGSPSVRGRITGWLSRSSLHPVAELASRHRLRPIELLPWLVVFASFFLFDSYLALCSQVLITIMFALSVDLVLGYAGIVTLGHAAFFGIGAYTAGIYAVHITGEPLSGLVVAGSAAAFLGFLSGFVILRTQGLALLMLTMAFAFLLGELANKATFLTGGADGLQGISMLPVLGVFHFDFLGKTAYAYCSVILFLCWLFTRRVVHSPFGRSLVGIRENASRMDAIGTPVRRRLLIAYTLSSAIAGIAGALLTQITAFVGLSVLSFERSGDVLIMLIFGGLGRLYGAFVGPTFYMVAQDQLAKVDPVFWNFWIGALLVCFVMCARGGWLRLAKQVWSKRNR